MPLKFGALIQQIQGVRDGNKESSASSKEDDTKGISDHLWKD
jgi:hypothetical protein